MEKQFNSKTKKTYTKEQILLHQLKISEALEEKLNNITYFSMDNPVILFEWAVENGYLLHGSPKLFHTLEPRQASDTKRPLGSLNAVYMSKNPLTSMAKTLLGNSRSGYRFERDRSGKLLYYDIYIDDLKKLNQEGYMYILDDKSSDDIADGDHVSYKPIKPLAIVKFKKSDFKLEIKEETKV